MFEAVLIKGGTFFKRLLESIKDLIADAQWDCSEAGIQLEAMDSAHVSLVSIHLQADSFSTYKCDKKISMGMNLLCMSKIFKCASNDDNVTIQAQDDPDVVTFIFTSAATAAAAANRVAHYNMKLMNLSIEHLEIPDYTHDVTINMPSIEFQRLIRDMGQFGDYLVISCQDNIITFTIDGDNTACNVVLADCKITMQQNVKLTFAIKYLNMFTKATCLTPNVDIYMSNNAPLMMQYGIYNNCHLRYYLAPKVDDD